MLLLSTLTFYLLPLTLALKQPRCLHSGDERAINEAFKRGGKGKVVSLCQGSVHRLNNSIQLTAPRQTLTTEGNPKGRERAMLIVEGEQLATAISADCSDCSYTTIRSLIVDGNRPLLLRVLNGGALIETGNGEGQSVRDCRLYEPRGWSALHFREGNRKQCRKGHIADNEIGPCGEEWDDEYDGLEVNKSPWGNPAADGISLACQDSIVERNTVFDATDGGIVLFGSAGSEVKDNHIFSRTRMTLGGINLVDYDPWAGDYSDVRVHHNNIHALSGFLKVGIVVGLSSWSDDTDAIVHSATITDNRFHGEHFGYGIVVSSARDFTILRNVIEDDAVFSGVPGPRCPKAPENGKPTGLLINRGSAKGTFQDDFVNGEVQHIICINPPDVNGKPYKPWRMRDSPAAIAAKEAEHPELAKTAFDSRLADAVVVYQSTLLAALAQLNDRIEQLGGASESASDDSSASDEKSQPQAHHKERGRAKGSSPHVDILNERLNRLEVEDEKLKTYLEGMEVDMGIFQAELATHATENRALLQSIYNTADRLNSRSSSHQYDSSQDTEDDDEVIYNNDSDDESASSGRKGRNEITGTLGALGFDDHTWLSGLSFFSVGGMVAFLLWSGTRRWRASRRGKGVKVY